jgi:DNA polymerase IV
VREPERSVGSQETFSRDTDDPEVVKRELLRMADRTASRLRKAGLLSRTVAISIRFADFTELTRSATVPSPTDVTDEIHAAAVSLYEKLGLQRARVRRVGVRAESLVEAHLAYRQPQPTDPERGWREAEQAIDAAVVKYGPTAVQRATLTRRRAGASDPPTRRPDSRSGTHNGRY